MMRLVPCEGRRWLRSGMRGNCNSCQDRQAPRGRRLKGRFPGTNRRAASKGQQRRSYLSDHLSRIAEHACMRRHVANDDRSWFNERPFADSDALEDGDVWSDPYIIFDDDRLPSKARSRLAMGERRAGNGIKNPIIGRHRVKVSVGHRRVPSDHDIVADLYLELRQQKRLGDMTVIADLDP